MVIGHLVIEKKLIVRDNTVAAESLGDFFKSLGKKGLNGSKKIARKFLENLGNPWILK